MNATNASEKADAPRQGLHDLADELFKKFEKDNSLLANVFGIRGMGGTKFLKEVFTPLMDSKGISHPEPIEFPATPDITKAVVEKSKFIAEWLYSRYLKEKPKKKLSNNLDELEGRFIELREKLVKEKDPLPFAVLIDDISNLPFDDLDWFQSVVLDTISAVSGSIIVLTSQNELNWHSWEMRNRCTSKPLPRFEEKEIFDICNSRPLAEKIYEFSAGHPRTVQALINASQQQNKNLASFTKEDANNLNPEFLKALNAEIDFNLDFGISNSWLKEIFYLASAADGFDADLVADIVSGFNIAVPEEITDIAWEMAFTGLATWDFDEKTYKIAPELRERIVIYMEQEKRESFSKSLEIIANSHLLRAEISTDKETQLLKYANYVSKSLYLRGEQSQIFGIVTKSISPLLESENDNKVFINLLIQEKNKSKTDWLANIYTELVKVLDVEWSFSSEIKMSRKNEEKMRDNIQQQASSKSLSRENIKTSFAMLLDGQLSGKTIYEICGDPGIGKSYITRDLEEMAKKRGHSVSFIDLHYPYNRRREAVVDKIVQHLDLEKHPSIIEALEMLKGPKDASRIYMGISETESFNFVSAQVARAIGLALKNTDPKNNKPVIFIDTFDENPGVTQLSSWLFSTLIPAIQDYVFFVFAGRKRLSTVKEVSQSLASKIEEIKLLEFTDSEIQELIKKRDLKGIKLTNDLIATIVTLSARNPLIVDWVLFYLDKFGRTEDWEKISSSLDKKDALKKIAEYMWKNPSTTGSIAALKAFQVAIHFGSHFNLDIFKAVVPASQLEGSTHKKVFEDLANYFYTRGGSENWTLHDQIRDWMRDASQARNSVHEFIEFSRKALEHHYYPKLEKLYVNVGNLSQEEESYLNDLEAEAFFHRLYIEAKPNHNKTSKLYVDIWSHLDNLWHHYHLEQMAQVIYFGREVQEWRPGAERDYLLTSILDAAQAWAYYSESSYELASEYAKRIVDRDQAPRRLQATAAVILGLLPTQEPERAIKSYLEPAKLAYQQILSQMIEGKLPNEEFTDSEVDVYIEIHQVLMGVGQLHLTHSFDLEKGEASFREAYEIATSKSWRDSLYAAAALNGWARILRFAGEYTEALNKVMSAISMYKKANGNLENDVNIAYFLETLGLIYKELEEYELAHSNLDKAHKIYENAIAPMRIQEATIFLEKGHVFLLEKNYQEAGRYIVKAHNIFSEQKEKYPWYFLNSLNKLGEYQRKIKEFDKARATFEKQKMLAAEFGHELWEYWAIQQIAEVDYEQKMPIDKGQIENLLFKYSQTRGRKFGPAFWRTKFLLYQIAKNDEDDARSAIAHLAEGLTFLAGRWKAKFWRNLTLLRTELMALDVDKLPEVSEHLIKFWKNRFPNQDPEPAFITMCETLKNAVENAK